jgi:hypothetical protein
LIHIFFHFGDLFSSNNKNFSSLIDELFTKFLIELILLTHPSDKNIFVLSLTFTELKNESTFSQSDAFVNL